MAGNAHITNSYSLERFVDDLTRDVVAGSVNDYATNKWSIPGGAAQQWLSKSLQNGVAENYVTLSQ